MDAGTHGAEMEMKWEDTAPILKSLMDLYDAHTEDVEICKKATQLSKDIDRLYDEAATDVKSSIRGVDSRLTMGC